MGPNPRNPRPEVPAEAAALGAMKKPTLASLAAQISTLELALEEVRREANTDPLTGLGNRRMLCRRAGDSWYVYADLDSFKAAQDSHPGGHEHGDAVLREFARFLGTVVRSDDQVAFRAGGDEFCVLVGTKEGARRVRDQIRRWVSVVHPGVTSSAGMGQDIESADCAMFINKNRKSEGR